MRETKAERQARDDRALGLILDEIISDPDGVLPVSAVMVTIARAEGVAPGRVSGKRARALVFRAFPGARVPTLHSIRGKQVMCYGGITLRRGGHRIAQSRRRVGMYGWRHKIR